MVIREGNIIKINGSITVDNVSVMTAQGATLLDTSRLIVDLADVGEVDSSIVSMLLEWLRVTSHLNGQLQFVNQPESLKSLVQLYGVSEFIPPETSDLVEE